MAVNFIDILKDNKKLLLASCGVVVMASLIAVVGSNPNGFFGLGSTITGNGGGILDGDTSLGSSASSSDTTKKTYSKAPSMDLDDAKDYFAEINTNFGIIKVDLFEEDTPVAVNNFVFLAEEGFYDSLKFHRVVKGFVIQAGDARGDGTGDAGYKFKDEIDAIALGLDKIKVKNASFLKGYYNSSDPTTDVFSSSNLAANADKTLMDFYEEELDYTYTRGKGTNKFSGYTVAWANSGPNTNGSQFFITVKSFDSNELDGRFTVFGKVVEGGNVVDSIEKVNVDGNGVPTSNVIIKSVKIVKK